MSALLPRLRDAGIDVALDGDDLDVRPRAPLTEDQLGFLRAHKTELVAELRAEPLIDPDRLRHDLEAVETRREARRCEALDMLAAAPESVRHAWRSYSDAHPDYVVVSLAIRGVGTCELSILRERYDGFALAELIHDMGSRP